MNIMEVRNVKKVYGSKNGGSESNALNGVSFSVAKGEFLGIMGPSGAGKSTLLNVISTIDSPTCGTISIGGKSFSNLNEDELSLFRRKQLGFIFQDYNLLDTLTLKENIILPLSLSKEDVASMEAKIKKISSILNIEDILGKYPYEVSGGQKQRTAAARAIITEPEIIFADEPTGALDSKSSTELLNNLSLLNKNSESTIIVIIFSTLFIWYANSFFIKSRKKEMAIYSIVGMKKREIGILLFCENMFLGILAIIAGIPLGIMTSKFLFQLLFNIMKAQVTAYFTLDIRAVFATTIIFMALFMFNSIKAYRVIHKYKLIELLSAQKEAEKVPKGSKVMALISIVMIFAGYFIAIIKLPQGGRKIFY